MPILEPLRSIEELMTDLHRLCQRQVRYLCDDRAGGALAAVLTEEEMGLVGQLVRTLKTISEKTGGGGTEDDLSKLSDEEIERRLKK